VPVALLWQLVELVRRWHVPPDELLSGSEVAQANPEDAPERISLSTMCDLLQRARVLTGSGTTWGFRHESRSTGKRSVIRIL